VYHAGQQDTQDIKTFKNATSEEDLKPYHDSSDNESGGFDHEDIKELVRLMKQRELDYPLSSSDAPLDYEPIAWDDLPGYSGNYSLADQDYMYNYLTHTGAYLWGDYEARRAQPSLKHLPHRLPDMGAQAPCQNFKEAARMMYDDACHNVKASDEEYDRYKEQYRLLEEKYRRLRESVKGTKNEANYSLISWFNMMGTTNFTVKSIDSSGNSLYHPGSEQFWTALQWAASERKALALGEAIRTYHSCKHVLKKLKGLRRLECGLGIHLLSFSANGR
jgi:hypothetical protein